MKRNMFNYYDVEILSSTTDGFGATLKVTDGKKTLDCKVESYYCVEDGKEKYLEYIFFVGDKYFVKNKGTKLEPNYEILCYAGRVL